MQHTPTRTCFSTVPSELSWPVGSRANGERTELAADSSSGSGSCSSMPEATCSAQCDWQLNGPEADSSSGSGSCSLMPEAVCGNTLETSQNHP
eukprot:1159296-Pelagomonas_calceolata.AAC.1